MIGPPKDTPEYAYPAWASALRAAAGQPGPLEAFRKDTGCTYTPPRSGLDKMIDESTGAEEAFLDAFVTWFNEKVWGSWDEPEGDIWGQ